MVTAMLNKRVDRLEDLMAELTQNVNRLSIEMVDLGKEMRLAQIRHDDFVNENRRYWKQRDAEMDKFIEENQLKMDKFIEENRRYWEQRDAEMDKFIEENQLKMDKFIEENRLERKRHNEQMAEISASTGRMVEDMVAPSILKFFKRFTQDADPLSWGVRSVRQFKGKTKEFDVIFVTDTYLLINETKKVLRPEDVANFAQSLPEARQYFPEYANRKIIGAMATLWMDASLLRYGERQGLLMFGLSDGLLQVLNSESFQPTLF